MNGYPLTCLATVESHEQVCDKAFGQNIGLPFAKVSKMFVNFHCFTKNYFVSVVMTKSKWICCLWTLVFNFVDIWKIAHCMSS